MQAGNDAGALVEVVTHAASVPAYEQGVLDVIKRLCDDRDTAAQAQAHAQESVP